MQPSDEVKSKLDIVDVIREYIPLKAAGTSFRALCPFHHEKSPSFNVSPEKQIWHCFGCGKGGDIFSFVMEMEGIEFTEALRNLANKAGVKLQRQDPKLASQKNRLMDIVELSAKYYHKVLTDSKEAESARKYLSGRGMSDEIIEEWRIGYSPESWDDLIKFLQGRGFKEDEIFRAGMSVKKEKMSGFYNRFRGRIMFPIMDVNVNVVGFSARVLPEKDDGKMGKYINSPQTAIYDKSRILFGLDKAKMEIKKQDLAILVEGQMDVITAHQNGFKNIVASSGTALTPEQVSLLKRYSPNIALAFDMDKAGEMAAERGIKTAMQMDMNIKVIEVPSGKDPDECIKNSPEEWRAATLSAKQMMQYYFDKTLAGVDLSDIDQTSRAAVKLLTMINELGSKIKQDHWLKILSERIDKSENSLREEMIKISPAKKNDPEGGVSNRPLDGSALPAPKTREEKLSDILIAIIFKFPELIELAINRMHPDNMVGAASRGLYRNLVIYYNNITDQQDSDTGLQEEKSLNYNNFRQWLSSDADNASEYTEYLDMLAILGERDFYNYEQEQAKSEIIGAILALKRNYLSLRMREIEKIIIETENSGDAAAVAELMKDFKMLADEFREFQK